MNREGLVSKLDSLSINNVFVYVGDAVRWDYLPEAIREQGTTVKTVASSTHSPTSFASLVSGLDAQTHGVYTFGDRLSEPHGGMFDIPGYSTRFVNSIFHRAARHHDNSIDPIYSVLGRRPPPESDPLNGLSEPFVVMERGPGGHAPYGDFEGTAAEYFETHGNSRPEDIQRDYEIAVDRDARLFESRIDTFEERDLTEDTLVIYTSDHGELLGEGGMLGHNAPMRPELVYVPTVFIHPDLPATEVTDLVFRHIDLLPTIRSMISDGKGDLEPDGSSLIDGDVPRYGLCIFSNSYSLGADRLPSFSFHYEGVWDRNGGYVFPRSSLPHRLSVLAGQLARSPKAGFLRNHFIDALRCYHAGATEYPAPSFSRETATQALEAARSRETLRERVDLSEEAEQHLEDLGYM